MNWKRTFWSAWFGQICSIMGFSFVLPFLPLYIRELGVSDAGEVAHWAGIAGFAAGITMALFAPVWGFLADRYGRKPMVLRSMFGGVVVLFLMAFCRDVTDLIILRLLQGMLTGTITAYLALVSGATPPERSGFSLGMMQAAVFFGGSAGPLLGGVICEHMGFKAAFFVGAGLLFAGGMLVAIFAEERFQPAVEPRGGGMKAFAQIFATAGFVAALLTLFQVHFANSVFQPVFPLYVEDLLGRVEGVKELTGQIIGMAGVAAAIAAVFLGRFSDAWGHRNLLIVCTLTAGLVTLPLAFAKSIPQLYALRVLFGFAAAGIMPSANAIIRKAVEPHHLGRAYGVTASVTCLGWGLGPLAGGYMAKHAGLREPFVLTGVILILTTVVVALFVKPGKILLNGTVDAADQ